jgi:hypothetical protein
VPRARRKTHKLPKDWHDIECTGCGQKRRPQVITVVGKDVATGEGGKKLCPSCHKKWMEEQKKGRCEECGEPYFAGQRHTVWHPERDKPVHVCAKCEKEIVAFHRL